MVEESDKSDSWGSLLINEILSKFNQMSGKIHNDDQEKHLLIGSKRPQISNEVSKKKVTKKIVVKGQYPPKKRYTGDNKFTHASSSERAMSEWCEERQKIGYGHKTVTSQSTDFTEKEKVIKIMNGNSSKENAQNSVQPSNIQATDFIEKEKVIKIMKENSSEENVQNFVQPNNIQATDFIEEEIDLEKVSLAPVKSSELTPSQVGNEKGSETAPAQTEFKSSDPPSDTVEIKDFIENKNDLITQSDNSSSNVSPDLVIKEEFNEENESLRIWNIVNEDLEYITKQKLNEHDKIPPLSEYDLESDSEDEIRDEGIRIKHEKEITIACAPNHVSSQANATSNIKQQISSRSKKGTKMKRLEITRNGAMLPDNIWLSNHMSCNRMSKKEYDANCKSLKKTCKFSTDCNAHASLKNLKAISKDLRTILAQGEILTKDWDKQKKIQSGKYGYLNVAVNYPEILKETKLIKQLVR